MAHDTETAATPEPRLSLPFLTGRGLVTWFGQDDALCIWLFRCRFAVCGEDNTVSASLAERLTKRINVLLEGRLPLGIVGWTAFEYTVSGDQATFYLCQPYLVTELGLFAGFSARDGGGMGLEDAHDLFRRGHLLTVEDPPYRLVDYLLGSG